MNTLSSTTSPLEKKVFPPSDNLKPCEPMPQREEASSSHDASGDLPSGERPGLSSSGTGHLLSGEIPGTQAGGFEDLPAGKR